MVAVKTADAEDVDAGKPHAVGSYAIPLILIVLVCGAFLFWRRRYHPGRRGGQGYTGLGTNSSRGVRLSTDDGPPAQAFISNDPSDDELSPSLPSMALPTLRHPAHEDSYGSGAPGAISEPVFSRRTIRELSRRQVGAVEGDSSDDEEDVQGGDIFKIGDGEEDRAELGNPSLVDTR